jgi:hypothetical protein
VPHERPAEGLEILGEVAFAPIPTASFDRSSRQALAPLPDPPVEDHVDGLAGKYILEVRVSCRFCARNDEEQTAHRYLPETIRLRSILLPPAKAGILTCVGA